MTEINCKGCVWYTVDCDPADITIGSTCYRFRSKRVECSRCGQLVVHGARSTTICMDCLVRMLNESGAIELLDKDKVRWPI